MTIENIVFEEVASPCERVEQQTAFYCGAACCKMVFDNLKIPVSQAEAYQIIHNDERFKTEELYSDPLGIAACLNIKTPVDISFEVQDFSSTDKSIVLDQIYYTLKFLRIPCLVLVQKGNHWVVISAVRMTEEVGGNREMRGVYIQNPWYGSTANKYVATPEFLDGWLTPIAWGETWKNSLVIMSDEKAPRPQNIAAMQSSHTLISFRPSAFLTKSQLAQSALREHGFNEILNLGGGAGDILAPIDVVDLAGNGDYTIIPMDGTNSANFKDFVYVAVDSASGNLLEIERFGNALQVYSDSEAKGVIQTLHPSAHVTIDPLYYWERSFIAMSRFQIFRKVGIDGTSFFLTSGGEIKADLAFTAKAGG
ncbi:hypothetical protein HH213_08600 [Duganella dendranthematis]|uniref:Peptidase C39-like domain-containing protein n=1 Tax=Duganella dendranthematis TaxID=2728021 RepID=A0ABX6M7P5_9BURK|nr:hypothetical protein [Duganella dendranthematis]QJD90150.1 hypothetical protein HH213_08600 [Duganella dendranthematis]